MAENAAPTIWVVPNPEADKAAKDNDPTSSTVAFWDRDPLQPGGEILITGTQTEPVEVVQTSRVLQALELKRLLQVAAPTTDSGKSAAGSGKG